MAKLSQPINCAEIDPRGTFEPFEGKFLSQITSSEMRKTKAGDGEYIALKLEVLDGPHKGRTAFDNLNVVNPSERAMEIAYQTLSAIGHATGVLHITDTEQLHNRPMMVAFAVDGSYTRVKSYESAQGGTTTDTQAQGAAAPAASTPPWKKAG